MGSLKSMVSRVNSRQIQMSAVFHSVPTTARGVPTVPKPPGPVFQAEASKSGLNQLSTGFSIV